MKLFKNKNYKPAMDIILRFQSTTPGLSALVFSYLEPERIDVFRSKSVDMPELTKAASIGWTELLVEHEMLAKKHNAVLAERAISHGQFSTFLLLLSWPMALSEADGLFEIVARYGDAQCLQRNREKGYNYKPEKLILIAAEYGNDRVIDILAETLSAQKIKEAYHVAVRRGDSKTAEKLLTAFSTKKPLHYIFELMPCH